MMLLHVKGLDGTTYGAEVPHHGTAADLYAAIRDRIPYPRLIVAGILLPEDDSLLSGHNITMLTAIHVVNRPPPWFAWDRSPLRLAWASAVARAATADCRVPVTFRDGTTGFVAFGSGHLPAVFPPRAFGLLLGPDTPADTMDTLDMLTVSLVKFINSRGRRERLAEPGDLITTSIEGYRTLAEFVATRPTLTVGDLLVRGMVRLAVKPPSARK